MDALRFVVLLREIQSGSGGGLVEVGAEALLGQGCQFFRVDRLPSWGKLFEHKFRL